MMAAMSNRVVYLHLGSPKTGTSYLQSTLAANRAGLLEDGVYYPKPGHSDAHHGPAQELLPVRRHPHRGRRRPGAWQRLASDIKGWDGDGVVVVSSELLAFAPQDQAERALEALGPAEVHLVLTLRDLVRQVPAVWQEKIKNRSTLTFDEFVGRLVEAKVPWRRGSWAGQEPVTILGRWSAGIPPERVHLVTVPPRGADPRVLWERFARVIGVDPDRFDPPEAPANASLGVAETEVIRRLNEELQQTPWPFYAQYVRHGIARGVLAGHADGGRLVLPERLLPWVEQRSHEIVESVSGAGYDIVGDLDDLLPPKDGAGIGTVPDPAPERLAWASTTASAYLARSLASTWKQSRRRARKAAAAGRRRPAPAATSAVTRPGGTRLRRAVRAVRRASGR